jgi:hypothetical protein
MMWLRSALLLGYAAAIASCATSVVPTGQTSAPPSSRILSSAFTKHQPGHATIVVKRDSGWSNAACAFRIYVNGSPQVELRTGESFAMHMPAGDYIVGATIAGICAAGDAEAGVTVRANEVRSLRVGVDAGGAMRVSPTAF